MSSVAVEQTGDIVNVTVAQPGTTIVNPPMPDGVVFIDQTTIPEADANGVVTLQGGKSYIFVGNVDLNGKRLETSGIVSISGISSETSFLTSTGLTVGVPLITSRFSIPIKNITIANVDTGFYLDDNNGANAPVAVDWLAVNFLNVTNVGQVGTVDNFTYKASAFLGSTGLRFTGQVGTIAIDSCLLLAGSAMANSIIQVEPTANITRRFRAIYSSFITSTGSTAISFSEAAIVPTEAYILDTINFSGSGTFLSGVDSTSNKALFNNCIGIANSAVNGQMFMRNNATATVITNTTDFFKVAGVTIASDENAKYDHENNRLTNRAEIARKYLVVASVSFNSGNNNICEFGFFDSTLNTVRPQSIQLSTANSGGRGEGVSFHCVVSHKNGGFIEVHARNATSTNSITVSEMNVVVTEIK